MGQPLSTTTKTNFIVSLHDTPAHHPHWYPCMRTHCKISSSVSVASTWKSSEGWKTSPKEKGQRIEVHHSEVTELLFKRADEGERKEERIERMERREGVTKRGGSLFYVHLVIGHQPKVRHGLQSWLASTVCKSIMILFVFHNYLFSLIVS